MGTLRSLSVRLFKSQIARIVGIALLAGLMLLRYVDPVFLANIRGQSFDLYQRVHSRPYAPAPVAVVDIDEASLRKHGQWPWPRSKLAELVRKLTAAGAIVIGFDMVFAEPDRLSPDQIAKDNKALPPDVRSALENLTDNETLFAQAIAASRVVVGETAARTGEPNGDSIPQVPSGARGADPRPFLPYFPHLVQNLPVISDAAAGRGVFTVSPDPDGIFRRVPLVVSFGEQLRLALSTEVLRIATGGQAFVTRTDARGLTAIVVGGVEVPTDRNGRIWPWFSLSDKRRYVSAGDILDETVPAQAVAGKMLLVGTSAVGLGDSRATPVDPFMPGVEVHAQIIENILTKQFLKRPFNAAGIELLATGVAGLLIVLMVPLLGALWAALAAVVFTGAFAVGSWFAFQNHHLLLDASFPIFAVLALFVTMATANYIREEIQKRQIRGAFGQYLSPALVDHLTENPDRLVLGGETRELSLLFTDVRGFTTISESYKRNPQGLTRLMNRFLTVMSGAILDQNGTIDKYMGDAIMAFWNAPLDEPDHAAKACRSAMAMIESVRNLNAERKAELEGSTEETFLPINVGVGINSGECVVGNMGSDMRFDYTALGDTVNLASRLEGQSKPYGVPIILGAQTAAAVMDRFAVLEIDLIRVKGKEEPERVYALVGDESTRASPGFAAAKAANDALLDAYRKQDWDGASDALKRLSAPGESIGFDFSAYAGVYAARIGEFRRSPPPPDWDCVYTAKDK